MWRTVIINQGERITTKSNWLVVASDAGENKMPLDDIYALIIDNQFTSAVLSGDADKLLIPELIMIEDYFEDEEDGE